MTNTHTLLPNGAVAVVCLHNNTHSHGTSGSGMVYLRADGRVLIDGLVTEPGDVLYLDRTTKRYVREPSPEWKAKIAEDSEGYIGTLVALSERINRNVARTSPPRTDGLYDPEDPMSVFLDPCDAWQEARYPTGNWNEKRKMMWLDGLSDRHDPEAIKRAVVAEYLDEHCYFEVGGYLHVTTDTPPSDAAKDAIRAYSALGGSLGATALVALGAAKSVDAIMDSMS